MNKLDPRKTALLIINMTNDLLGWEGVQPLVPRLQKLLNQARKWSVTVVFSSLAFCNNGADSGQLGKFWEPIGKGEVLVKGTQGVAILPELTPRADEPVLERNRYSAFYNSDLDRMLRDKGVETLIIGGYSTNFCCDSTARDANFRDYHVIVLEDGTAPIALEETTGQAITAEQVQKTVLANLRRGFAQVATVDGTGIEVTATTLARRLRDRHMLVTIDPARETVTVRRVLEGRQREVLHLSVKVLGVVPQKPDIPDKPDILDNGVDENVGFDVGLRVGK